MKTNLTEEDFYDEKDNYYIEIEKGTIYNSVTDENICDVYNDEEAKLVLNALNNTRLKEFIYGEIIERRPYSASKMCEVILEFLETEQKRINDFK